MNEKHHLISPSTLAWYFLKTLQHAWKHCTMMWCFALIWFKPVINLFLVNTLKYVFHLCYILCVFLNCITLCNCLYSLSLPFFCFSASRTRNFVFLIFKIQQYGGGDEFTFFQGIYVRIDISIFIRPMITKFDKQIHLQELTQLRLIKMGMVQLGRMVAYLDKFHPIKSNDPLITWSCKITWQTKIVISPLPQCLWQSNLAESPLPQCF